MELPGKCKIDLKGEEKLNSNVCVKYACCILFLIITGCTSFPAYKNPDDTLLIFMVTTDYNDKQKLEAFDFMLYFKNVEKPVIINGKRKYFIKKDLTPGVYEIEKIVTIRPHREITLNTSITVKPGHITMCPFHIYIYDVFFMVSDDWSAVGATRITSFMEYLNNRRTAPYKPPDHELFEKNPADDWFRYLSAYSEIKKIDTPLYESIIKDLQKEENFYNWQVMPL